jgi:hypothetical protein
MDELSREPRQLLDGLVVKENDDLMAATRYALMMLRYTRARSAAANFNRRIEYPSAKSMGFA